MNWSCSFQKEKTNNKMFGLNEVSDLPHFPNFTGRKIEEHMQLNC